MAEKTLTTGQVMGITGIPLHTLQRYVRDFGDFLSPEARKHTQGRRFTLADVKYIFWVRHLYFQRWSPSDIRAVLRGERYCETLPQFEINDDLSISQATRDYMLKAYGYAKEAQEAMKRAEAIVSAAEHIFHRFEKTLDHYQEMANVARQLHGMKEDIEYIHTEAAYWKANKTLEEVNSKPNFLRNLFG